MVQKRMVQYGDPPSMEDTSPDAQFLPAGEAEEQPLEAEISPDAQLSALKAEEESLQAENIMLKSKYNLTNLDGAIHPNLEEKLVAAGGNGDVSDLEGTINSDLAKASSTNGAGTRKKANMKKGNAMTAG